MLKIDGLNKAIVGVVLTGDQPVVCYDYEKAVRIVTKWQGMNNAFEAIEYIDFNIIQANFGEKTPVFIRKHKSLKEIEDWDYMEDDDEPQCEA
tara:strand:+ start:50 stop:328 length:279 start_codon:yes stop_codon:yes gene_type:complete